MHFIHEHNLLLLIVFGTLSANRLFRVLVMHQSRSFQALIVIDNIRHTVFHVIDDKRLELDIHTQHSR
jgi:hypothetical protein